MRNGWKLLLLFLILVLPGLVFTFLKMFGENKFDVPVFYSEGLNISDCPDSKGPHKIPAIDSLGLSGKEYKLIYVNNQMPSKEQLNELRRISMNNPEVDLLLFYSNEADSGSYENYRQENWELRQLKKQDLQELNHCGFGNIDNQSLLLTDPERQIRGFYDLNQKKELDRLEGEIKILTE